MTKKLCKFESCSKDVYSGGLCSGHKSQIDRGTPLRPLRNYRRKNALAPSDLSERERFAYYTKRAGDCVLWQGYLDHNGYGHFNKSGGGRVQAHRYAYALNHGEIPESYEIDHLCHTRNCVNPQHLEAITKEENHRRMIERLQYKAGPRSPRKGSGRVGVIRHKSTGLWMAHMMYKGKKFKPTYHKTFEEAVASREAMERLALEEETL